MWLLRVVAAGALVAVIPGVLTVMAWRPRARVGFLELIGVGLGVSFALVQAVTIAAVMYSWSVNVSLALLAAWTFGHAIAALRAGGSRVTVTATPGEIGLAVILVLLGIAMYAVGSPFDTTEPRIHISLVRRVLNVSSPTLYNMYLAPDIVYTYPFPGIHYMLALMSRAGDVDPFFLYHKTRVLWAVAAPILLYSCTLVIFESARIALAATLVAVGLVANGTFGAVPDFSWAQLAPYSHASDIAMGVMLPALLLLSLLYLGASDLRERRFFLTATLGLALALIMVHPREIVQFLVYLGAFSAAGVALRSTRQHAVRAAVVVAAVLAMAVLYSAWHARMVPTANDLMQREHDAIAGVLSNASVGELFGRPVPFLSNYLVAFPVLFFGWNWLVLLASPFALFVLRRRKLALLLATGIAVYMLLVRFPALALPYLYVTYFEMMYTPVRNVIFFIHVLAGVCLYLCAARLSHLGYITLVSASAIVAGAAALMVREAGPILAERPELSDLLFAPVLIAFAGLAWWAWGRRTEPAAGSWWVDAPRPRWTLAMAVMCVPLLLATELPESSLRRLASDRMASLGTPISLVSSLPCLRSNDYEFCPPPSALVRYVNTRIPVDSAFAVDVMDEYQSSLFMPQQMVAWSGTAQGLIPRAVFLRYYQHYDRSQAAHGEQPLFSDRETRAERLAFIRDLGVTHVLVNPRLHQRMSAIVAADLDVFAPLYDDGRWALYEVASAFRGLRL